VRIALGSDSYTAIHNAVKERLAESSRRRESSRSRPPSPHPP